MKHAAALSLSLLAFVASAQTSNTDAHTTPTAAESAAQPMPYYNASQALLGVYSHRLPPLAQAFEQSADQLQSVTAAHCQGTASLEALRASWEATLLRWSALSTPEIGPLVARRSQREIDFWPTRERLLRQALAKAPQTLADMERVGTPAKGFPAFEQLLTNASGTALAPATCHYTDLIAQGIAAEAHALNKDFATLAQKDWAEAPDEAASAFGEWINQWLAGWERLRWAHIEKPIQAHRTTGAPASEPVAFPRLTQATNLADWRAQWQSLQAMARLRPDQYAAPPQPGEALAPIEAMLLGKGLNPLAQRWAQAIDQTGADLAALTPESSEADLLAMTQRMKAVTVLYQNEVAAALDVPLGFSSADGD
jgi:predicted lipoprotein